MTAEKQDPRVEITTEALIESQCADAQHADLPLYELDAQAVLDALESAGWRIVRLEQVGWQQDGFPVLTAGSRFATPDEVQAPLYEGDDSMVPVYTVIEEGPA